MSEPIGILAMMNDINRHFFPNLPACNSTARHGNTGACERMPGSSPGDPLNDPEKPRYGSAVETDVVGAGRGVGGGAETVRANLSTPVHDQNPHKATADGVETLSPASGNTEPTVTWPHFCGACQGRGGFTIHGNARNSYEPHKACNGTGQLEPYIFPARIAKMAQGLCGNVVAIAQKLVELGA